MSDGKHQVSPEPVLSNRSYDILKDVVTLVLPGLATFYFALAGIWHLPYAEQIMGTFTALGILLGIFVKIASKRYANLPTEYDGELFAVKQGDNPTDLLLSLDSQEQAEQIREKGEVTFKVVVR